ncbi:hypothetical protein JCM11491_004882 [Sporobolomyces phaffii]
MAVQPLARHNGYTASPRDSSRSAYATSASVGVPSPRPVASTSATPHSPGVASTSTQRSRPPTYATPVRHTPAASGGTAIGEAASTSGTRPIGRARSEVDIRSRSRRLVDPVQAATSPATTPSTSPTAATRIRPSGLSPSLSQGPNTPGFATEYSGSPASFVTARSIPLQTPPPRPTRSPHRDVSPCSLKVANAASRSNPPSPSEPKTTLIHGTEFEIISPVPPRARADLPCAPSRTSMVPTTSPPAESAATSPMSSFTFPHARPPPSLRSTRSPPPAAAAVPVSRPAHHQSTGSVFRLERPHALPESYLAVRDSLTQTQIDQFTLSLAAQFPASWTTTSDDGESNGTSCSIASSPTKSRPGGGGAEGGGGESDEWARQRRMSSLISGLGMVLGSSTFGAGALVMEEEDEEGGRVEVADSRTRHKSAGSIEPHSERREEPTRRRSRIASASDSLDSGGPAASWATPRSRTTSTRPAPDSPLSFHLDFDPVTFAPLTSGSISLPLRKSDSTRSGLSTRSSRDAVAVEFGYATGDAEGATQTLDRNDVDERVATSDAEGEGSSPSIKQLVRQSWRLSSSGAGSRDFKPLSPKRRSVRPTSQRFDDGLGITLELLEFEESSRAVPSSYTPSSRPVLPRGPSIDRFQLTSAAPVTARANDLPSSPPLVAEPPTPVLTMTPALSSSPDTHAFPPTPIPLASPHGHGSEPSDKRRSVLASSSPQPRTSSLAPDMASSASATTGLRRQSSHEDGLVGRRRSVLGASKSSKRISALFSSGIDKVRHRTSSHNSKDADDEREKERDDGRTARRRALTDGLISGPISSPALSASTLTMPLPPPSFAGAAASSQFDLLPPPPPPPSASLTQSPFQGRTWRSTLGVERFEHLAQDLGAMEMRRQEVIWELCETERSFVNGLRGVIQVFTLPLRTRTGTWIKGVPVPVSRLLDWLDDIVHLHSQIFDALEAVRCASPSSSPVVARIADAFLPFVARLEVHQPYLVRFEAVTRQIDDMTADPTSDFGEFVRMQSSLPECGSLSLSSFLLKPVQRLMKYPLFFRQLCDLTPPTHLDHFSTLSLLHSTDSIIRVMQEVKTREDEYEETKVLAGRIAGLPRGFTLACRDRRLVAHGVLKRVHVSDKDRSLLELDAIARAGFEKPPRPTTTTTSLRGTAPISPGLSPVVPPTAAASSSSSSSTGTARPRSTVSESSSSSRSVGSLTYASDLSSSSSGWNSPTTPGGGAFHSPTRLDFGSGSSPVPSPLLRPDSIASTSSSLSSAYNSDSAAAKGVGGGGSSAFDSNLATLRTRPPAARRVVKTKAKETSVYVFVFSDLVVLATKASSAHATMPFATRARRGGGGMQQDAAPSYRAIETVGLSRVLGVSDLSGKTEHEHLIEVDLLPMREGHSDFGHPVSLSHPSSSLAASSIYLTLPPPPSSSSRSSPVPVATTFESHVKERVRWLQAFERSYLFALRSLSFPSSSSSAAATSQSPADTGSVPKSPSQQLLEHPDAADAEAEDETKPPGLLLEREERAWWAARLNKVRHEMEGTLTERRNELARAVAAASSSRGGGGIRPGQVVSYSGGQILPARRQY